MYVGETGNESRYTETYNKDEKMLTDKNLQEAINSAFEQAGKQTGTLRLNTLKHLDQLRQEQLRRARCDD